VTTYTEAVKNLFPSLSIASILTAPVLAQSVDALVAPQISGLVQTYKGLHAHPELSHHEEHTSALLAGELRKAGYSVTERVGKYPDGTQAYGLVAILQNGAGPKLLIRTDMDALPIIEETGLPYASTVKTKNPAGQDVGVMHACGHDIHVTTMIGVARVLAQSKSRWHGTVMLLGQPSEETIDGAKALLADHLYERFGRPDLAIALHDTNGRAAGTVSVTSGAAMAGSTSVDVVIRGIGGHGSQPQVTKDPIVMAGEFIVLLQTIVSRQENPRDPSVVTVGDIHGGTKRNIIPNEVKLELTTRAFTPQARQVIIDGIKHTAQGVGAAAGIPDELMPMVTVLDAESTPVLYNDPALTVKVKSALAGALGVQNVFDEDPIMASEDFGVLGLEDHQIPTVMFWLGAMDPEKFATAVKAGKPLPGLHTSKFEPVPETTLRTGVTAMSSAAIALLQ
jgi:amidohydrolase